MGDGGCDRSPRMKKEDGRLTLVRCAESTSGAPEVPPEKYGTEQRNDPPHMGICRIFPVFAEMMHWRGMKRCKELLSPSLSGSELE